MNHIVKYSIFTPYFGLLFLFFLQFYSCGPKELADAEVLKSEVAAADVPKNIILMIGDGMALSQISAEVWWTDESSWFELFPYVGFQKTMAFDTSVTDSAAGATAFACGCKTNNTFIGLCADKTPCKAIAEDFKDAGKAVGVVVTSSATHATPASFLAHSDSRAYTELMAVEYAQNPLFDCLIAGGEKLFRQKLDGIVPYDVLKEKGFSMIRSGSPKKIPETAEAPFVQFVADDEPKGANDGRTYLPEATEKVCAYLEKRSEKGFFLMVEGSQIDWALHANDKEHFQAEMRDFDKTVGAALQYAAKNGETLVIVTGDHECGGLGLNMKGKRSFDTEFTTKLHTGTMVPVLAFGPGAEAFQGIYENTEIYEKMKKMVDGER